MTLVKSILRIAKPYDAKILVNSDMNAAKVAHGVHLPQGQSCRNARATLGPDKIIGVSAHNIGEAGAAASAGADYATISPIFPTQSKPGYGPPLNLDGLQKIVKRVSIPLIALGGSRERRCCLAGARVRLVAVMGQLCGRSGHAGLRNSQAVARE